MRLSVIALMLPVGAAAAACTEPRIRKSWSALRDDERDSYLKADLCLMETPVPPRLAHATALANASNLYDALQAVHFAQAHYIHRNGVFLAWHRYFVTVHERLLRSACGYLGPLPYWDEQAEVPGGLANASVWGPVLGFGSFNHTDANNCTLDGPFANATLTLTADFTRGPPTCITSRPSPAAFARTGQDVVDKCDGLDDYASFTQCYYRGPHAAGHGAVGAIMVDVGRSPGHPLFYLHHANLDRLWWKYQARDLPTRLAGIGGDVVPDGLVDPQPKAVPPEAVLPYNGESGNVTTLGHVLWMGGVYPNATIRDVMDLRGHLICADYE